MSVSLHSIKVGDRVRLTDPVTGDIHTFTAPEQVEVIDPLPTEPGYYVPRKRTATQLIYRLTPQGMWLCSISASTHAWESLPGGPSRLALPLVPLVVAS